ncbi:hypothetical protein [Caballeronia concitans]|uniref:hypothetical protein n=1 Tax=Caballeronia concitans TaxID=1777133 RepID=UPI000AC103C1|nr:hypothetical protein [Caballeronia concitans]
MLLNVVLVPVVSHITVCGDPAIAAVLPIITATAATIIFERLAIIDCKSIRPYFPSTRLALFIAPSPFGKRETA